MPENCAQCLALVAGCSYVVLSLSYQREEASLCLDGTLVTTAFHIHQHLVVTSQGACLSPGSILPSLCPSGQTEAKVKCLAKVIMWQGGGGIAQGSIQVSHRHSQLPLFYLFHILDSHARSVLTKTIIEA